MKIFFHLCKVKYMYASVTYQKLNKNFMDQSDIQYILEILNDAILEKDWDKTEEARETLKEFLDNNEFSDDE